MVFPKTVTGLFLALSLGASLAMPKEAIAQQRSPECMTYEKLSHRLDADTNMGNDCSYENAYHLASRISGTCISDEQSHYAAANRVLEKNGRNWRFKKARFTMGNYFFRFDKWIPGRISR